MNALKQLAEIRGTVSIDNGIATLEDGTSIDLSKAFAQQEELLAATRLVLHSFQDGSHYETGNPYCRSYVRRALEAIKDFTGFAGDWKDANPLPLSAD